ncbi:MAG: DUF3761 domain-containing protein [Gemmatimonadales bacterium]
MRRASIAAACLGALAATGAAAQQRNPTAHCYDGTYYYGASRRLACANHRGVSEWLARPQPVRRTRHPAGASRGPRGRRPASPHAAARKRPPHPRPAGATARCHDGTWSRDSRRTNACTRHGGIASWMGRR